MKEPRVDLPKRLGEEHRKINNKTQTKEDDKHIEDKSLLW